MSLPSGYNRSLVFSNDISWELCEFPCARPCNQKGKWSGEMPRESDCRRSRPQTLLEVGTRVTGGARTSGSYLVWPLMVEIQLSRIIDCICYRYSKAAGKSSESQIWNPLVPESCHIQTVFCARKISAPTCRARSSSSQRPSEEGVHGSSSSGGISASLWHLASGLGSADDFCIRTKIKSSLCLLSAHGDDFHGVVQRTVDW